MPTIYRCPSEQSPLSPQTSYLMLVGPGCISTGPTSSKLKELRDGASHTIAVVETANSGVNWMQPQDCDVAHLPPQGNHPGVLNALFADGSVRGLRPEELRALLPRPPPDGEAPANDGAPH